jgi:transmembrane sensor
MPAIAILLATALAGGVLISQDGIMRLQADAMSGIGEMPVITLADGSTMQLNAYSAIAYDFTAATRTVRLLRGEAYFQVAKDPTRPFVVEAGSGRTTALGTAFNVRLGETDTDVTVTEHAVSVAGLRADVPPVRVQEGNQAAYGANGMVKDVRPVDTSLALAWRSGLLVVDNASLADVVAEISRHFSGRIIIPSTALAKRRVSGTFSITDAVAALAFLEQSLGIKTNKIGPLIVIRE